MTKPITLDALGPTGTYQTRNRQPVVDVTGHPIAELSLVPRLFITRTMTALGKAQTLPLQQRLGALATAGERFATGRINDLSPTDYQHLVSRTGTPVATVRAAIEVIRHSATNAYPNAQHARPVGAVTDWRGEHTRTGRAVWIRRGNTFAVHAAGNHPAAHSLWLQALALGYRVAVRPSRREPFTPHRLISALRAAGFGDDQVVLLPTDYTTAEEILRQADLSMVYGGQEVINKYATDPTVLPNGPGRSKILITAETD